MSAREDAVQAFVNGGWSEQVAREIVASVRAEALAERDAQTVSWLGKKAVEFGRSNRENRAASDAVARMADKLSRGAVRDDETGVSELYRLRAENNQLRHDITGACLARYEEEQENERLRLAWHSARERAKAHSEGTLRQVANRDTWMGWAKAAEAEVATLRARVAELEAAAEKVDTDFYRPGYTYADVDPTYDWRFRCDLVTTHPENGKRTALGWRHFKGVWEPYTYGEDDWDIHQVAGTKVASETVPVLPPVPQQRQAEDPHDSVLHHDYALGRDLPAIPHQRDEEAL